MQYLDASEYVSFGLGADTPDTVVAAASALIDSFCRCVSLGVTQYVERFRPQRGHAAQLSFAPLVALTAVRVRYRRGREETWQLSCAAEAFLQPEAWTELDVSTIDVAPDGLITLPQNFMGWRPAEIEATYTAGYSNVPDVVKVACAQIVRNAQAMPSLNVSRQEIDGMRLEYFSASLLDADVQRLLQPFVAQRMG